VSESIHQRKEERDKQGQLIDSVKGREGWMNGDVR